MHPALRLVFLGAIWGISFILLNLVVPELGSIVSAAARITLGAFVVSPLLLLRPSYLKEFKQLWRHYILVGAFSSGLPFLCYAYSAKYLPASYLVVINATTPFQGALFGVFMLKEPFTRRQCVSLCLGLIGVAILVGLGPVALSSDVLIAIAIAALAPLCYGYSSAYISLNLKNTTAQVNAVGGLLFSSLLLMPLALTQLPTSLPSLRTWISILVLGFICTGYAYISFYKLITEIGPTLSTTVTFLVPAFGFLWAFVLLGEIITLQMWLGLSLIVVAMLLVLKLPVLTWVLTLAKKAVLRF